MRRRDFIKGVIGSAVGWPLATHAQQEVRMRRVGVLMPFMANDPEERARNTVFEQSLQQLGWTIGRDLQIDYRSSGGDAAVVRRYAAELVALAPDVIMTTGSLALGSALQATRSIPIVFTNVADPVGAGFIQSLARPGGNATGFTNFEYTTTGKWMELLKQIAPHVTRVAVLRDPTLAAGIGQFTAIQSVAQSLRVELTPLSTHDVKEIEAGIAAFARSGNGGLIVTAGQTGYQRDVIIGLASRYKLPAVYPFGYYAKDGGLISYGSDPRDLIQRTAAYVDRILKGAKPADLPVVQPTTFDFVINLKTAKAIGFTVPQGLVNAADEVIE